MIVLQRPLRAVLREPVDARQVAAVWQRVEARRRRPARGTRAAALALGACTALAAVFLVLRAAVGTAPSSGAGSAVQRAGAVPADRVALRLADGAELAALDAPPVGRERVVQLSDGTRIALAAGTRLVPRAATASLTALTLELGRARFDVAPQGARRFEVRAGSLVVTVVGTAFAVEASPGQTRVAVEHGRVRVRSPEGEVVLGAGQTSRWTEPSTPPLAPTEPRAAAIPDRPGDARPIDRRVERDRVPPAAQAAALLQLSDRARAAGRPAEAASALERLLARYPRDSQAPLAALTLARLQLDDLHDPPAAARAFERALALGLPRALQEDALAQLVRAHAAAGHADLAARAADRYTARYPGGRFNAEVRRWARRD